MIQPIGWSETNHPKLFVKKKSRDLKVVQLDRYVLHFKKKTTWQFLCLFGMVKWPFQGVKWPPTKGWNGHFESPGKGLETRSSFEDFPKKKGLPPEIPWPFRTEFSGQKKKTSGFWGFC